MLFICVFEYRINSEIHQDINYNAFQMLFFLNIRFVLWILEKFMGACTNNWWAIFLDIVLSFGLCEK